MIEIEIIAKFISIVKIPLKYLIPTVFIVCCLFTFSPDWFLTKIGVWVFKEKYQSIIGTMLIISFSLIVIYTFYYIIKWLENKFFNLTYKQRSIKKIANLNSFELGIIFHLYFSDGYCNTVDFNNPIIQGLLSRKFIYTGNNQAVTVDWDNHIDIKVVLQPFVYQSLDYYFQKLDKKEEMIEKKIESEVDENKKRNLNKKLEDIHNKPLVEYLNINCQINGQ